MIKGGFQKIERNSTIKEVTSAIGMAKGKTGRKSIPSIDSIRDAISNGDEMKRDDEDDDREGGRADLTLEPERRRGRVSPLWA